MVALVLLGHELPVGVDVVGVGAAELEPVEFGHVGKDVAPEILDQRGQRRRVRVEVDEHHVEELLDADGAEAEILQVKAVHVLGVAGRPQGARGIVGPGVEGAGEDALVAAALGQHMAAVHAHIVEGAQAPVLGAGHQHLLVENLAGDVVAGQGELVLVADELPGLEPDFALLALEDVGIVVVLRGQGVGEQRVGMDSARGPLELGGGSHGLSLDAGNGSATPMVPGAADRVNARRRGARVPAARYAGRASYRRDVEGARGGDR